MPVSAKPRSIAQRCVLPFTTALTGIVKCTAWFAPRHYIALARAGFKEDGPRGAVLNPINMFKSGKGGMDHGYQAMPWTMGALMTGVGGIFAGLGIMGVNFAGTTIAVAGVSNLALTAAATTGFFAGLFLGAPLVAIGLAAAGAIVGCAMLPVNLGQGIYEAVKSPRITRDMRAEKAADLRKDALKAVQALAAADRRAVFAELRRKFAGDFRALAQKTTDAPAASVQQRHQGL